jgi:hypothetical protein
MDFYIKKFSTLPLIKMQVVNDGRSDFRSFMESLETSTITFSMTNLETGIPKIVGKPAYIVEKTQLDPNALPEYYIYYQFRSQDTNKPGRFEGEFNVVNTNGRLIVPIRDRLFINILDSFILESPCC